jgi:hypothetical protein
MAIVLVNQSWHPTLLTFVNRVLQKCGVLAAGETATAEDASLVMDVTDGTFKALHADGLLWWSVRTELIAFSAGSDAELAPTDFAEAAFSYWTGAAGRVRLIERGEFEAIVDKGQVGAPELLFIDAGWLRVWPVPAADGVLRLTYQRALLGSESVELDLPTALVKPMIDLIAAEVLPYFGVAPAVAARLERDAARATMTLRKLSTQRAESAPVQAEYL